LSDKSPAVAPHFPLAAIVWPIQSGESAGALRSLVLVAVGTALMALSAKVSLPLPYVP